VLVSGVVVPFLVIVVFVRMAVMVAHAILIVFMPVMILVIAVLIVFVLVFLMFLVIAMLIVFVLVLVIFLVIAVLIVFMLVMIIVFLDVTTVLSVLVFVLVVAFRLVLVPVNLLRVRTSSIDVVLRVGVTVIGGALFVSVVVRVRIGFRSSEQFLLQALHFRAERRNVAADSDLLRSSQLTENLLDVVGYRFHHDVCRCL
jgi:hypothetical protein